MGICNGSSAYAEEGDAFCTFVDREVRKNDEDDAQRRGNERLGSVI